MNNKKVKSILAAALASCVFLGAVNAQEAPEASVDANGNLVLGDGTVINRPDGAVNEAGNLVVGGQEIVRPEASINEVGNLVLGDGSILEVPEFPTDGFFLSRVFGDTLVEIASQPGFGQNGWLFSYNFKNVYNWGATNPNYVFFERWGTTVFVPDRDRVISDDGLWVFAFNFPEAGNNTWVFIRNAPGFLTDLRTATPNPERPTSVSSRRIESLVFVRTPTPGATDGAWYAFVENSARTQAFVRPRDASRDWITVWPRN